MAKDNTPNTAAADNTAEDVTGVILMRKPSLTKIFGKPEVSKDNVEVYAGKLALLISSVGVEENQGQPYPILIGEVIAERADSQMVKAGSISLPADISGLIEKQVVESKGGVVSAAFLIYGEYSDKGTGYKWKFVMAVKPTNRPPALMLLDGLNVKKALPPAAKK